MTDYKNTLNLPQTDFPMKADLAKREPGLLAFWDQHAIYSTLREQRKNAEKFILHDGPPYANGQIHIGHALNKILKDIVLKSKSMSGLDTPYVPGWDCHGLPIELNVEKSLEKSGKKVTPKEFRELCRGHATGQIKGQIESFKRLGILGDWEHPYTTMDFSFEAGVIRTLAKMITNGHLHRGSKPVHWCVQCGSALAEAEVEYQDKTSFAIDVGFKAVSPEEVLKRFPKADFEAQPAEISVIIWTTTPWTLPANQAVALNANVEYALVETKGLLGQGPTYTHYLILAASLVDLAMKRYGITDYHVVDACLGEGFEGLKFKHPFLNKEVPIVMAEHVTADSGTGAVHIAPAHGQEDYTVSRHYELAVENPVNDQGCFISDTPFFAGKHVYKVNEDVIAVLQDHGALLHHETLQHSYPHCWRHKKPLIFRATPQWFISMDQHHLRAKALSAVAHVTWSPEWAQARMAGMIAQRPDWCISRQRLWGTPIALFIHKETDELHPDTPALIETVAQRVEKEGIEAWYELNAKEILGKEAEQYRKVTDTLDVWFDSGASYACVLSSQQSDLYLEGSDQFRGWFQSALLIGTAIEGKAPYKALLSHGFTLDLQGNKMSKSLGNVISPQKIWDSLGSDILRLWTASSDFRSEATISDEILQRTSESYRRIRNTARFLLSNLFDFDPKEHLIEPDKLLALDRWAVYRTQQLSQTIRDAYNAYEFHLIVQKIQHFCTVEMGGFYLDIIKDRQYTTAKNSLARRSAQTALYHILESMVRWLAPVLSFTAEEIWQNMPWRKEASVFLTTWDRSFENLSCGELDEKFWNNLQNIRESVNQTLEKARASGDIGSSLEAIVDMYCSPALYQRLTVLGDELHFLFITSGAHIHQKDTLSALEFEVEVTPSKAPKCERCWHRAEEIGQNAEHPNLCERCVVNVYGDGEKRQYI